MEQSAYLVGGRLLYFSLSFLTARLVPSALLIFSCSQKLSNICKVSSSNLTAIWTCLGLSVGRPIFFFTSSPHFCIPKIYTIGMQKSRGFSNFFALPTKNKRAPHSAAPNRLHGEARSIPWHESSPVFNSYHIFPFPKIRHDSNVVILPPSNSFYHHKILFLAFFSGVWYKLIRERPFPVPIVPIP